MTWPGYFALGGQEVGNSARAVGLQESTACPSRWIVDRDVCEATAAALNDFPYTMDTISLAPWYDPDNPERSSRILGLYVIEIAGLEDDNREVSIEQKVTDGASIGRTRRASRTARVRAMLTAQGRDALEAGMTWLRGTLDARECGLHSSTCGMSDFEYFVDCPPDRDNAETDEDYAVRVDALRRYMHSVKCTSGPIVTREIVSNNDLYHANIVEFAISSELAGVFTKMREIEVPPTIPSVVQDIPYNLVTYPSAELAAGTVTIATNYSANPSLETDGTGWVGGVATVSGSSPAAYFTSGRVTGELAAVGVASYRGVILGNGATTASGRAQINIYQEVDLTAAPDDARMSFTMWVAALSIGGVTGADIISMAVEAEWRNGGAILSTDVVGTTTADADFAGKAFNLDSRLIPSTATNVRVRAEVVADWSSSATPANNSEIRVYVDALAATVP